LAVPLALGTTLYQIVFDNPDPLGTQPEIEAGAGSLDWGVAPELSFVSENVVDVILTAFAKLSLVGAGATTINVGNVTVCVVRVVPPPGGGFWTPTEFVLPKLAMKPAGIVAVSCVALTKVVGIAVPPLSGFIRTLAFEANPVPITVINVAAEFTGLLVGLTEAIVGAVPSTVKVSALLVPAPVVTVICGVPPPPVKEVAIVAVNCVSEPPPCVTPVVRPFHLTVPPVSPFPLTVNTNGASMPAGTETGPSEEMCGPGNVKLFSTMSHAPRP
jgi:hypothetical protein